MTDLLGVFAVTTSTSCSTAQVRAAFQALQHPCDAFHYHVQQQHIFSRCQDFTPVPSPGLLSGVAAVSQKLYESDSVSTQTGPAFTRPRIVCCEQCSHQLITRQQLEKAFGSCLASFTFNKEQGARNLKEQWRTPQRGCMALGMKTLHSL